MAEDRRGSSIWAPAFSILGIVIAAYLSFLYGQETNRREVLSDQRTSAYVQYVQATARLSKLRQQEGNTNKVLEQEALRNAARFRAAIYGSDSVLNAWELVEMAEHGSEEWTAATVS